ncbi:hypothetical protein AUR66_16825 [Haloferax profundi]|uniref:D-isomer specific 2-hydroxyacid dehydrogenase NAD-binding domain-containing protein n=1 Tax=Haloferax profundi TaxID=1544718 RepID=A0A0W1SA93_9EURY|nr:hypothetical protein AUR66_16825 [Haloferax profundi]
MPDIDTELVGGSMTSLQELLERSDVVALNAELTDETRGLIGEEELTQMQESAFLVNTARGPIVDEEALVDALRSNSIAGAGLDVFATEPLRPDSVLLDFENVVITPHTSAVTTDSRVKSIRRLTTNVTKLLAGEHLPNRYLATPSP